MEADGPTTRIETMAEMMRARMLVEIDRDALYVSDEYQLGYGESETAAKTTEDTDGGPDSMAGTRHRSGIRRKDSRHTTDS